MNKTPSNIFICAGEASGDTLGAMLAEDLLRKDPTLILSGMGSSKMQAAGVNLIQSCDDIAVIGLWEVFTSWKKIRAAYQKIKKTITQTKPELVILIDYPGFNLRMAKIAKQAGCKVMYYVSPKIWAWKQNRIKIIKRYVDHMAVLFAFEEKLYQNAGVAATFVGHPLVDKVSANQPPETLYAQWRIKPQQRVIALLPGSRKNEIKRLTPTLATCVEHLTQTHPNLAFILPLAPTISADSLPQALKEKCCIVHDTYNALSISYAAIAASGTVTLEVALMAVPMAIIYRVSWLTYFIGRLLVKLTHIGLCNIITHTEVAPEFIQHDMTTKKICRYISRLLDDPAFYQQQKGNLAKVRQQLTASKVRSSAADVALRLLKPHQ